MSTVASCFAPLAVGVGEPIRLDMQRLLLTGQVLPAGARLVVQHVFRSAEEGPLEVIYSFPLPRDAALRRFRITGEGFEAESELQETAQAVKTYEEGIARGSLSTLARQYGDGLVMLTVGNLRPKETVTVWLEIVAGVELRDDGFRFRFPFTLAPTYHASAKVALISPGEGEMELPAAQFGDVILPRFREDASALHQIGFDLSLSTQPDLDEIGSPSHPVRVKNEGGRSAQVVLATGKDVPDRDLVLDGHYKSIAPQVLAGRDKEGISRYAVIVPSTSFGVNPETPKRVVILLDRSGSMGGEPISQARKAIEACLGVLSDADSFGLVAFDNTAEEFHPSLQSATRDVRDRARQFLNQVNARGGTELVTGFLAAAKMLEGDGGDVLIMTDGQVAGTETILEKARAAGVRLHCLGIGSASQDRFLTLLARETGGVSRFVTPRERVDLSAVDLFASIGSPVAAGLKAGSNVQPQPAPMVFSGTPVLLFGEGEEPVAFTWDGGHMTLPVSLAGGNVDSRLGETVWLLQGSRLITDWESRYSNTGAAGPLEKRQDNRVAQRLRDLSRTYGLASREMSLVSVVKRAGDRPGDLPKTSVVPVGMAQDTDFNAYFAASPASVTLQAFALSPNPAPPSQAAGGPPLRFASSGMSPQPPSQATGDLMMNLGSLLSRRRMRETPKMRPDGFISAPPRKPSSPEDELLDLASRMESDGGMPGPDPESRACSTAIALLAFLSQGHTATSGAFRSHVARLLKFLKSLSGLSPIHQQLIAALVEKAQKGTAPSGDWIKLAQSPGNHWDALTRS